VRQPGYDTTEDGRTGLRYFEPGTYDLAALDTIRDLGPLTRSASGASLVVWPEAAIWVDPRRDPLLRPALQRLAAETGAALVVPFFLPDRAPGRDGARHTEQRLQPDPAQAASDVVPRREWGQQAPADAGRHARRAAGDAARRRRSGSGERPAPRRARRDGAHVKHA
jgi:hypothetical protein